MELGGPSILTASTLHANIPCDLLLQSIEQLINEAYRLRVATYLIVKEDRTAYCVSINATKS